MRWRRRQRELRAAAEAVEAAQRETRETLHVLADEALRLAATTDQLREALEGSGLPVEDEEEP